MSSPSWREVEEILQKALQRDPAQRDLYVREACRGDHELQREVASLLAHHDPATVPEGWAARPAAQLIDAPALDRPTYGPLIRAHSRRQAHPEMGYWSCLGIIHLAEQYSPARTEAAAERALLTGACRYQEVRPTHRGHHQAGPKEPVDFTRSVVCITHFRTRTGRFATDRE